MTTPTADPAPGWLTAMGLGLASRVVVVSLGLAFGAIPWPVPNPPDNPVWERHPHPSHREQLSGSVIEPWYRFDANWYAEIARSGYSYTPGEQSNVAFFPLLPSFMAAGERVGLDPYLVGIVVPNLAFALGLGFFARAVTAITGDGRLAWRSCLLLIAFPSTFFCSAPYSESLAFLATALALWGWSTGRWWVAAIALGFGVLARPTVAIVPAVLILDRFLGGRLGRPSWWGVAVVMALPVIAYAGFCAFLGERVGDPFAFVAVQEAWGRTSPSWNGFIRGTHSLVDPGLLVEAIAVVGFLALGFLALRRGPGWGLLVLAPVLQLLATGSIMSAHRLVLAGLPAFVEAAVLLRNRWVFWGAIAVLAVMQAVQIFHYVHWRFAG